MSRLPIRVRLALASAAGMAIVLALVGSLLYVRLGSSLLDQIDEGLQQAASDANVSVLEDGFVQVIGASGRVESTPPPPEPVVGAAERRRAGEGSFFLTRGSVPGLEGAFRLYVSRRGPDTVVAGASLEDRQEALDGLRAQLLVVGPLALLLTTLGGYVVARAALRPVDAMRRRAAEISSDRVDQRLPLPAARDEVRRLGETLNEMLGRLEDGLVRERRFVADASHELRTPLASLRTELELALRRPRSRPELEHALRSASEEVDRVIAIAEDLLLLARADEGRLPLDTATHVVRELLDAVAGRHGALATAAGRRVEVDAPADLTVTGDRERLERALGNLVDNALRYGSGTVRLEAVAGAGVVELRVSDEGAGFPPAFLPHAFERFSRADAARAEGGAGLGLALAEAVARAHGGSAIASNRATGGARVALRMPATASSPGSAPTPTRSGSVYST